MPSRSTYRLLLALVLAGVVVTGVADPFGTDAAFSDSEEIEVVATVEQGEQPTATSTATPTATPTPTPTATPTPTPMPTATPTPTPTPTTTDSTNQALGGEPATFGQSVGANTRHGSSPRSPGAGLSAPPAIRGGE